MAISEFEEKRCEREMVKFLAAHRPPVHIRHEIDIAYRLANQSVEIFEIRPHWQNTSEKIETPVAKATYVKSHKEWRIYWHRSDMEWHRYEPNSEVKYFEEFLSVVDEDSYGCFWG
jgi:hypothetical protein